MDNNSGKAISQLIGHRRKYKAVAAYSGWPHFINLKDLQLYPEGTRLTGIREHNFFSGINSTGGIKGIMPLLEASGKIEIIFTATMVKRRLMDHGRCYDVVTKLERPGSDVQVGTASR